VRAEADALVTELPRTCTPQGVIETAYAEQVARAVFEHAGDAQKLPNGVPLVAIVNAGGLRAPLLAGRVRFADLFAAFPFENSVSTCVTTVAGLRRFVDNATHRPSVRERFPFGLYGAHMTFTRRADGQLDLGALALDAKKSPAATTDPVVLALPDFVLWGGDGLLDGVACTETHESATRIREAWRGVLEREHGGCDGVADNVTIR
jgi:2',3'-cyclic-nucleotide 2'-phosphodiesterase (5'-nucleotidase family)